MDFHLDMLLNFPNVTVEQCIQEAGEIFLTLRLPWPDRASILKRIRKEGRSFSIHAVGLATIELGADGVKVDELGLEEGAGDAFQRPVHLLVEFDLVIEGAEDVGDRLLLIQRRQWWDI